MKLHNNELIKTLIIFCVIILFANISFAQQTWKPNTDWGHWILGHKSDFSIS